MNRKENFTTELIRKNPVFPLYLGLCSTLTITTTLNNAISMGVAVIIVLIISNVIISLVRNITPSEIHTPVYIVIITTLVKIIQMLTKAYTPSLDSALDVSIPLIVVNYIILGRTEVFASKNSVFDSAFDGLGMGLGYTVPVILMSAIHQIVAAEILSFGNPFGAAQNIFSVHIIPEDFVISMFSQPFDVFCTFACLAAGLAAYESHQQNKAKKLEKEAK